MGYSAIKINTVNNQTKEKVMSYQTKAEQKRDLDQIDQEYEKISDKIQNYLLKNRNSFVGLEAPKWDKNSKNLFESLYYYFPYNIAVFTQKKSIFSDPISRKRWQRLKTLLQYENP